MLPTDRPTPEPCFTAEEVRRALLGRGGHEAADRLARHLAGCPACAATAEAIDLESGIVSGLRRDHLPPPPSEHELADVVARVSRIDRSSRGLGARSAGPVIDLPGRLGPYRLAELLGVGGMGAVYRAEDVALHRFVAVKVVNGSADTVTRARFLSEARALAAVRHDNIVTVHYVGEEPTDAGTIPYLAMELLEGQALRDWMATSPRPPVAWVVRVGRQIAAGLAFVHGAGMVHRDVKSANLWLEAPQGWASQPLETRPPLSAVSRVKLLDFGLAHPPGTPVDAAIVGTPAYMAPEQARGEEIDSRADLFGLGCVLYELCTGQLPFPERHRLWRGGRELPPEPVRILNPEVPERLAVLITRLLAADRGDRPASAREVELELASIDEQPVSPTVSARGDATVAITPARRPRWHVLAPAAALLVTAVVVTAVVLSGRTDTGQSPPGDVPVPPPDQTGAPVPGPNDALVSADVIDDEWCRTLATRPPQKQLDTVLRTLGRLNPDFDWTAGSGWVEPDRVIRLTVNADTATDLRPVRALTGLTVLRCRGSAPGRGGLTDLSPLSELTLKELHCRNNPKLRNLAPIRLDGLEFLDASFTGVTALTGLAKAPIVTLKIAGTSISDLGPVRRLPRLRVLDCAGCPIANFEAVAAMPIRELRADVRADRDAAVLGRSKTLEKINGVPVKQFWKQLPAAGPED